MFAARTFVPHPTPDGPGRAGRPHRRRRGLRAGLVCTVALAVMAVTAPAASAAPWTCDAFGYLYQTDAATPTVHSVIQIDLATGQFDPNYASTPGEVNSVGYNVLDDFMYGLQIDRSTTPHTLSLVRIHSDGSFDNLGLPAGLPADGGIVTGDVDPNGHFWVLDQSAAPDHWYEIDLVPGSPTYGDVIGDGTIAALTGVTPPADWVWINGALYGLPDSDPATGNAHVVRWTPGATAYEDLGAVPVADPSGAVYTDAAGFLYASINAPATSTGSTRQRCRPFSFRTPRRRPATTGPGAETRPSRRSR